MRLRRCAATARRVHRLLAIALAAVAFVPASASAQIYVGRPMPRAGTIEIGGGAVWTGGYDAGSRDATESSNSSTGGAPITLFTSSSRAAAVTGVEARAAVYLGSRVSAEGLFHFSRPNVRVTLDDDFENALPEVAVGSFSSYLFGGSLVYHFGRGKVVPFVLGGGGYLRLLDEDNAEVNSGNEAHAGGGVKIWFGSGGSRLGVRIDARLSARSKSPGFEDKRRLLPTLGGGLLYRF
jgi:hypothetical protein